jgi:pyrrolidone-carboxylate peptidase
MRRAGLKARLSANAGDYVCNETLYLSLGRSAARMAGFIHVPRLARASRQKAASRSRRPDLASLTRAALIAILVTARKIRQDRAQARDATPAHQDFVKTPGKRPALDRVRSMA